MQLYTILQEFPQQEHFSFPHGKRQSYTPLRIPLATMGSEVNPRSHLMSSQLMLASIASATYTASPLSSPKSFPEENARSLLEKFFNLKWQETEENNLRKINCNHESAPNTSVQCTCVKSLLCCTAGLKNAHRRCVWSQSSASQNLWLAKHFMTLVQVSLAQSNSPSAFQRNKVHNLKVQHQIYDQEENSAVI